MNSLAGLNPTLLRQVPVQVSKFGNEQTIKSQLKFERKITAPIKNITA